MKPTYTLKTTAQTSSNTTSADTARILAPLMTATLQAQALADKKRASRPQVSRTKPAKPTRGPVHRIVHDDCLAAMAKIPDAAVDFICADFPYNISGKGGLTMRRDQVVRADF